MIDVNSQFFAILTRVGEAKQANADALGIPWNIAQMGVGDANGTDPIPDRLQTKLINERRRAPLNQLMIDPLDPSVLIAEQVIPADVGGWWVREIGLYDSDGDLIAVANCAPSYKSLLSQGSGRTQIVRMNFIISSITNVVLKIDPAVVLATREYVDNKTFASLKEKPTTINGYEITDAYNKSEINIFLSGKASRATTLEGYGITDAYTKAVMDQTFKSKADKASTLAGYGIGDAYDAITIDLALSNKANKASSLAGYGITDAYTKTVMDQTFKSKADKASTLAGYGIGDAYDASTIDLALSNKANKAATLAGYGITDAYTKTEAGQSFASKAVTLAGYNITDAYTKSEMNQFLGGKSAKASTLAGYGITDAIRNANPLPSGSIDIHADLYAFLTSPLESSIDQNCFWDGTAWYRHDTAKPAVCVAVANGSAFVRSAPAGAGPIVWSSVEPLWTSSNATLSSSAGNGTLRLPNGWIQQVFDVSESTGSADYRFFPVSFPSECFGVFPVLLSTTSLGYGNNFGIVVGDVTKDRFLISAGGNFSVEGRFRVLALGR